VCTIGALVLGVTAMLCQWGLAPAESDGDCLEVVEQQPVASNRLASSRTCADFIL
jgi:hypothetical protein